MRILGFLYLLIFLPFILGNLIIGKKEYNGNFISSFIIGFLSILSIFHVVYLFIMIGRLQFHILYYCYIAILSLLGIFGIIIMMKEHRKFKIERIHLKSKLLYLCFLMVLAQMIWQITHTMFIYGDDFSYITMVNDIVESDTIYGINYHTGELQDVSDTLYKYLLTSYYPFLAVLAKFCNVHPLIVCKTILPIFLIPISYMVEWEFSQYLFIKYKNRITYLICYSFINFVAGFSWYTVSFRSWTWVWQSKAVLATIILPFVFYYSYSIFEGEFSKRKLFILMIAVSAACGTTIMGIGLTSLIILSQAMICSIRHKNIKNIFGGIIACSPALISMVLYLIFRIM